MEIVQRTGEATYGVAGTHGGQPSRDELFHVLRNQRRRFAIHHLKRVDGPVDVGELATQVAAWENDVEVVAVTSQQRRRVYNALQQTHLDELRETGLVEVDRREVRLTEDGATLDCYLDVVADADVPWSEYYLAVSLVGLVAVGVTWFDVGPFAGVPDVAAGVFLAVVLACSACVNYYDQHRSRVGSGERPPELRGDRA